MRNCPVHLNLAYILDGYHHMPYSTVDNTETEPFFSSHGTRSNKMKAIPIQSKWFSILILGLVCLLAACGGTDNNTTTAQPTPTRVNGFGTAANHVHSLIALPNHVLVLATHYGIFRSEDDGATWKQVAAGPNQLMQGLMAFALGYSSLNPQRLFVLTQVAVVPHSGILGLYTSADQGRTWKLAITQSSLGSPIFTETPGNDTPDEVYIYIRNLD